MFDARRVSAMTLVRRRGSFSVTVAEAPPASDVQKHFYAAGFTVLSCVGLAGPGPARVEVRTFRIMPVSGFGVTD